MHELAIGYFVFQNNLKRNSMHIDSMWSRSTTQNDIGSCEIKYPLAVNDLIKDKIRTRGFNKKFYRNIFAPIFSVMKNDFQRLNLKMFKYHIDFNIISASYIRCLKKEYIQRIIILTFHNIPRMWIDVL